jgi:antitoxin component of RelBE/YafQ-DinJ toxin-antitoxin module
MKRYYKLQIRLTEEEKARALAICAKNQISLSELFRAALPKNATPLKIQTLLKLEEVKTLIQTENSDPNLAPKFQQLETLLTELREQLCQ